MSVKRRLLSVLRRAVGVEALKNDLIQHINHQTTDLIAHTNHQAAELAPRLAATVHDAVTRHDADDELRDFLAVLARSHRELLGHDGLKIEVRTDKPVAYDSPDHLMPWGTKQDNSVNLRFNLKLARWIPLKRLSVLDLGCAGGGFVKSVIDLGALAVGIEGSDYSNVRARAEWATIPDRLFTADVTEPFEIRTVGQTPQLLKFAVITAWEFIEHIRREQLPGVFRNIDAHLQTNGVVILSVSPNEDVVNGVRLHQTVEGREWWLAECQRHGFVHSQAAVRYFGEDWVRSEPNAPGSFHLVLTRHNESLPRAIPTRADDGNGSTRLACE